MNPRKINKLTFSILTLIIIILCTVLGKVYNEKQDVLNSANKKYLSDLDKILSGLNVDYSTGNDSDKIYLYSNTISSIESARQMYSLTQYSYRDSEMSNILDILQNYMRNQFLVNFDDFNKKQLDLYNGLNAIYMNPSDKDAIQSFNDYLSMIEKK